jgi:hypothetical protein
MKPGPPSKVFCECGGRASKRLGHDWICERCFALDSQRARLARAKKRLARAAKKRTDEFFNSH